MKRNLVTVYSLLALLAAGLSLNVSLRAQNATTAPNTDSEKIDTLFKNSGVEYFKKEQFWGIKRQEMLYFFVVAEGTLVGGTVLAKKSSIQTPTEAFSEMLKMNHQFDYVKLIIDSDGDLGMRFDTRIRLLDQKEFDGLINQLFNASGIALKRLRPSLISSK